MSTPIQDRAVRAGKTSKKIVILAPKRAGVSYMEEPNTCSYGRKGSVVGDEPGISYSKKTKAIEHACFQVLLQMSTSYRGHAINAERRQ